MKQLVIIDRDTLAALHRCVGFARDERASVGDFEGEKAYTEILVPAEKALSNSFIAVSERLPEDQAECDILLRGGSFIAGAEYFAPNREFNCFGVGFQVDSGFMDAVTHWRATEVV